MPTFSSPPLLEKRLCEFFAEFNIIVHVAQFNTDEVAEYLPHMARKYGLNVELVEMQWKLLPLRIHSIADYRRRLPQALIDLARRDREDAHVLALARSLSLPIWSDRDFDHLDVESYSTARLLRLLGEKK